MSRIGALRRATLLGAALIGLALGQVLHAQEIKLGDKVPDHAFSNVHEFNGFGSMESLRGRVVLIDFWGQH